MTGTAEANGPLWGERAADWAQVQEPAAAFLLAAALDRLALAPDARLLDAGCGSGLLAAMAAQRGAAVAGIDAAEPLLAEACRRTPAGDFRRGDLEALPFRDDAFDAATAVNAVQYAADPAAAVRELARVVRPGGRVLLIAWGAPDRMEASGVIRALAPLMPPPPPGSGGPFALAAPGALQDLAAAGGLRKAEAFEVSGELGYRDLETAVRGFDSSGVAARARALAGEAAVTQGHRAALAPLRRADGEVRVSALFAGVVATA